MNEETKVTTMSESLKQLAEDMSTVGTNLGSLIASAKACSESFEGFAKNIGSAVTSAVSLGTSVKGVATDLDSMYTIIKDSETMSKFSGAVTDMVDNLGKVMKGEDTDFKLLESLENFCSNGITAIDNFRTNSENKFKEIKQSFRSLKEKLSTLTLADLGESLSASASAIGTKAGTLLSAGLVAGIAVAAAAVTVLAAAFQQLMESNDGFRAKVNEAWSGVTAALQPVKDAFNELKLTLFGDGEGSTDFSNAVLDSVLAIIEVIKSAVTVVSELVTGVLNAMTELWKEHGAAISEGISTTVEIITGIVGGLVDIVGGILTTIAGLFSGDKKKIKKGATTLWNGIKKVFSNAWKAIKKTFSGVKTFFSGVWKKIKNEFKNVKTWFKNRFKEAWNAVKNVFSGVSEFFGGIWTKIKNKFTSIGSSVGNALGNAFKKVVNSIIGFAENTINSFIRAINGAIKLINLIPGVSVKTLAELSIPRMAEGGMVNTGQLFIAREAGPELVGSFNGASAVMNNNQIVQAVSAGVYEAVSAAMGNGSGNWTIQIVDPSGRIKSEEIISALERKNRRDGRTVVALGV